MLSHHPFTWIVPTQRKRVFIVFFLLALVLAGFTQAVNAPLITPAAPSGIVSFELARSLPNSQRILASWDGESRVSAGLSLGMDYLFILAYAGAIGLGCALVGERLEKGRGARLGFALAWGMWAAALLDGTENYALIRLLLGSRQTVWPLLARWCAIPKFVLVGAGLLYVVVGAVWIAVGAARNRTSG